MSSFYETQPWLNTIRYGRADLTIHPLVRDAYKVACLIEDCGASVELTRASCAAFQLTEELSEYLASLKPQDRPEDRPNEVDPEIRVNSGSSDAL